VPFRLVTGHVDGHQEIGGMPCGGENTPSLCKMGKKAAQDSHWRGQLGPAHLATSSYAALRTGNDAKSKLPWQAIWGSFQLQSTVTGHKAVFHCWLAQTEA